MKKPLPFRPNVCMLVYNRDFKIWVGKRIGQETWQLPQGGADDDVSLAENATREVMEELGVEAHDLGHPMQLKATHRYTWSNPPKRFLNKFQGQEQTFWVVAFWGKDETIRVTEVEHPEFSQWRWIKAEDVLNEVEPVRRDGYRAPLAEFISWRDAHC